MKQVKSLHLVNVISHTRSVYYEKKSPHMFSNLQLTCPLILTIVQREVSYPCLPILVWKFNHHSCTDLLLIATIQILSCQKLRLAFNTHSLLQSFCYPLRFYIIPHCRRTSALERDRARLPTVMSVILTPQLLLSQSQWGESARGIFGATEV